MDFLSVGVIQNLMMAVILVDGVIVIENAVCEFEIVDLVIFFNEMGVKVKGVGIEIIIIIGVEKFYGMIYNVV